MLKSHFTIGWRSLVKQRAYSLINIVGLAIGIASCILLAMYVRNELSYDKDFEDIRHRVPDLTRLRETIVADADFGTGEAR